ncbi:TRAP transporter small permease [Yoonia sp. 208BN28-4]|uniref:TRAP transporter small permease n=1 Tax=Yoonia sp. 208BN28-4 TaxID=3126505 RepID=UPI0030AF9CB3
MEKAARGFAVLGGMVLSGLIVLTCLSILGRMLNNVLFSDAVQGLAPDLAATLIASGVGPIAGAYEIVEAGMAFVVFAFLPLCHLHGAHASVDIFTSALSDRTQTVLRVLTALVFAAVVTVITYELAQGMMSKQASGQTTFILQFPVWWSYAASLVAATGWAVIAIYIAVARVVEFASGTPILPEQAEPDR